jgi:hypothetical protein
VAKSEDLKEVMNMLIDYGQLKRMLCYPCIKKDRSKLSGPKYLHFFNYLKDVEQEEEGDE